MVSAAGLDGEVRGTKVALRECMPFWRSSNPFDGWLSLPPLNTDHTLLYTARRLGIEF